MKPFSFGYLALRWVKDNATGPCSIKVGQERAEFHPGKHVVLDFFPQMIFQDNPPPSPRKFKTAHYSGD